MPLAPTLGRARWSLQLGTKPNPFAVTIGFAADSDAHAQDFVDAMRTTWETNLKSSTSSEVSLLETSGEYNDGGTLKGHLSVSGTAGTGGTGVQAPNCALLVQKSTGLIGRKFRGRMYWPSMLADSSVDELGVIDSSVRSTLQTHFDAVLSDLQGGPDFIPVILHGTGGTATTITGVHVESMIATQRRRLR